MKTIIALDQQELATVLAALRFWQREAVGVMDEFPEDTIATNDFTIDALDAPQIDTLCERINITGDTTGALEALRMAVRQFGHLHTRDLSATGPVTPTPGGEVIQKMRDTITKLEAA